MRPSAEATDFAWCAGFVDGEGCLSLTRWRGRLSFQFRVSNTEREPIERLQATLGGTVRIEKQRPPRVCAWVWTCRKADFARVLGALLPYLTVKRGQAEAALRFLAHDGVGFEEGRALERALSAGSKRRSRVPAKAEREVA